MMVNGTSVLNNTEPALTYLVLITQRFRMIITLINGLKAITSLCPIINASNIAPETGSKQCSHINAWRENFWKCSVTPGGYSSYIHFCICNNRKKSRKVKHFILP